MDPTSMFSDASDFVVVVVVVVANATAIDGVVACVDSAIFACDFVLVDDVVVIGTFVIDGVVVVIFATTPLATGGANCIPSIVLL